MTLDQELFRLYAETMRLAKSDDLSQENRLYWQGRAESYLKVISLINEGANA